MAKGQNKQKGSKKTATKSLKEKKAEKRNKKLGNSSSGISTK